MAVCCCSASRSSFEQACVLYGDDGLGGEALDQLDLLVGEGADLLTIDADRTDQPVLLEHRHDQQSPGASKASNRFIGIFHKNIGNVDHLFRIGDAVKETCPATRNDWIALSVDGVCLRRVVQRNAPESIALIEMQIAELGVADAYSVGQHGREYRL